MPPARRVTHVDLLARGLASSELEYFMAEPAAWQRFVRAAKNVAPQEFRFITFDESSGTGPFSEEADQALHALTQAGLLSVANFAYRTLAMNASQRAAAANIRYSAIDARQAEIDEIAQLAAQHLAS